jgi:hypothetical protein
MSIYTTKEVRKMIDVYSNNPCLEVVDKLGILFNKPRRSIISKLVKEGVYVSKGYRTKRGEIPITKLALVYDIEDSLGVKLPGLDKAPKSTLVELKTLVLANIKELENVLVELGDVEEVHRVQEEMGKAPTKRGLLPRCSMCGAAPGVECGCY